MWFSHRDEEQFTGEAALSTTPTPLDLFFKKNLQLTLYRDYLDYLDYHSNVG